LFPRFLFLDFFGISSPELDNELLFCGRTSVYIYMDFHYYYLFLVHWVPFLCVLCPSVMAVCVSVPPVVVVSLLHRDVARI